MPDPLRSLRADALIIDLQVETGRLRDHTLDAHPRGTSGTCHPSDFSSFPWNCGNTAKAISDIPYDTPQESK
jgi:RNA polymerase sigma factor (sigma-70 family)